VDPADKEAALASSYDAAHAALVLVGGVTAPECVLIEALPARYPQRNPSTISFPGTTPLRTQCVSRTKHTPTTLTCAASSWKRS
jgi:hypothetical protein